MNFIKKIVDGEIDEKVHHQFVRFGKGEYKRRFLLNLMKSKKIKIKTSFEFANDLVKLSSMFGNCKVSGIVLSKKDISDIMSQNNIQCNAESKKGGIYYQNNILDQELTGEKLIELEKEAYFTLLDVEGEDFKLKIKKKLPKPGKSEDKIDDKFCQLEVDEKFYSMIKDDLFWDIPDVKKVSISHEVVVSEIIIPDELKSETDYAKVREMSRRKGKITRKININGQVSEKIIDLEA